MDAVRAARVLACGAALCALFACGSGDNVTDGTSAGAARPSATTSGSTPVIRRLPTVVEIAELQPGPALRDYVNASEVVVRGVVTHAEVIRSRETGEALHRAVVAVDTVLRGRLARTTFEIVEEVFLDGAGQRVNIRGGSLPMTGAQIVVFLRVTDRATEAIALLNSEGYLTMRNGRLVAAWPSGRLGTLLAGAHSIDQVVAAVAAGG